MRPRRSLRVMLDTNAFDRLASDPEAVSELSERRDLRLYVSEVQLAELSAVPDAERRERLLALARSLCVRVSAVTAAKEAAAGEAAAGETATRAAAAREAGPFAAAGGGLASSPASFPAGKHAADALIAAAALARCDLFVSDDAGLVRYARERGLRASGWERFAAAYVFVR